MKIHLAQLMQRGSPLEGEDPAAIMDVHEEAVGFHTPISYRVMAQQLGGALLVQGQLWTKVSLRCGRCLQEFEVALRASEFIVHRPLTGEEEVDLTAEVREDILLQLPAYPVCSVDCKGLCPGCGQDLNRSVCQCARTVERPVWAALDEVLRWGNPDKRR
jgi:uncharacterized protein